MTFPDNKIAKRNIVVLIILQTFIGAMIPTHFLLGGLAGKQIAPTVTLATLPIAATIIGSMLSSLALGQLMPRFGRAKSFAFMTTIASFGAIFCGLGVNIASFPLLILGSLMIGGQMATQTLYRFAAIDAATPDFHANAISFTLVGGLLAALVGPNIGRYFSDPDMSLAYFVVAGLGFTFLLAYAFLNLPKPELNAVKSSRPILSFLREPQILGAILIAASSYALMNMMMTATPLAIEGCGFSRSNSASVVQFHVLAMFAPSFFTGGLIKRFGARNISMVGIIILIFAAIIALLGVQLTNFYIALILLGLGWNFGFIGGTAMLAKSIKDPNDAQRVQSLNDSLLWLLVAIASLSSGYLMNGIGDGAEGGWRIVNIVYLPSLIVMGGLGLWLTKRRS